MELAKTLCSLQEQLYEIAKEENDIIKTWYGTPPCQEKENARTRFRELIDYRNTLLDKTKELGAEYEPKEFTDETIVYLLTLHGEAVTPNAQTQSSLAPDSPAPSSPPYTVTETC